MTPPRLFGYVCGEDAWPGGQPVNPQDVPLLRQLKDDPLGLGRAAKLATLTHAQAADRHADRVTRSVCPYCAVGCGQRVYVKDERVIQIEGDPASPISREHLCPKGSASKVHERVEPLLPN